MGPTTTAAGRTTFVVEISRLGVVNRLVATGAATGSDDLIRAMALSPDDATLYIVNQQAGGGVELSEMNTLTGIAGSPTMISGPVGTQLMVNRLIADTTGAIIAGSYRGDLTARFPGAPITTWDTAFFARIRGGSGGRYFNSASPATIWSLSRDDLGGFVVGGEFELNLTVDGTLLWGSAGNTNIFFGRTTL